MCVAIVGGLLVASVNTVGAMRSAEVDGRARTRGQLLARELMSEILTKGYVDPELPTVNIANLAAVVYLPGKDVGEVFRLDFDDVDDYVGWTRQPPENRDGSAIAGTTDYRRSVTVKWVDAITRGVRMTETGLKQIAVTVTYGGDEVATATAYKSLGLPGANTGLKVLLVLPTTEPVGALDQDRIDLLHSWGYMVYLIDDSEPGATFDAAVAENDVAWVSAEVSEAELSTKLTAAAIGLVNGNASLVDELGLASGTKDADQRRIYVTDNSHAITDGFAETAYLDIFATPQPMHTLFGFAPAAAQILAYTLTKGVSLYPSLVVLESGESLYGGGISQGRRAQLPWGRPGVGIAALTASGQTILRRSLEWAAGNLD